MINYCFGFRLWDFLRISGFWFLVLLIVPSNIFAQTLYHESCRPQFHFTAAKDWLNDPNGLVFYAGEYHLFFQRTKDSLDSGKKSWGHAVGPDLLHWTQIQTIALPGAAECPDFFPINLDGDAAKTMWVVTGANGRYLAGAFDGKKFAFEGSSRIVEYGANCYAVQTFSDIPASDGRRIQIGWMAGGKYPQMPFNQQMSIPCQLTLRSTPDGPRPFKYPVKEVDSLHGQLRKPYNLEERTAAFGEEIIAFAKLVPLTQVTRSLIDQVVRSGTSIGANYCEADDSESKKDFLHKIRLCRKESRETKHWLRMMAAAEPPLKVKAHVLWQEAKELNLIFGSIAKGRKG